MKCVRRARGSRPPGGGGWTVTARCWRSRRTMPSRKPRCVLARSQGRMVGGAGEDCRPAEAYHRRFPAGAFRFGICGRRAAASGGLGNTELEGGQSGEYAGCLRAFSQNLSERNALPALRRSGCRSARTEEADMRKARRVYGRFTAPTLCVAVLLAGAVSAQQRADDARRESQGAHADEVNLFPGSHGRRRRRRIPPRPIMHSCRRIPVRDLRAPRGSVVEDLEIPNWRVAKAANTRAAYALFSQNLSERNLCRHCEEAAVGARELRRQIWRTR